MERAILLKLFLITCALRTLSVAQIAVPSAAIKDPTAVAIVQKALAVSGSNLANYQDSVASGMLTMHGNQDASFTAKIESQGRDKYRMDVQRPVGTASYLANRATGCISEPNQSSRAASFENILTRRVDYIPALSLLGEYQTPSVSVQYGGADTVNGQTADVVSLTIAASKVGSEDIQKISQHLFYIDQKTGLVTKVQSTRMSENPPGASFKAETYYSDYRSVNGIMVPFSQKLFIERKPASDLILTSVTFNSGVPDSEFTLSCGGDDAN